MPIYEFECNVCGKTFDYLAASMRSTGVKTKCPHCDSAKTRRKMSVFAVKSGAAVGAGAPASGGGGMCGCGKIPGSCSMK